MRNSICKFVVGIVFFLFLAGLNLSVVNDWDIPLIGVQNATAGGVCAQTYVICANGNAYDDCSAAWINGAIPCCCYSGSC